MKKIIISVFALSILLPTLVFASFDTSLKYGSKGSAVTELQDFLQNQGVYSGKIDGWFGLGTLKAVEAFQTANSLQVDGYFGKASRAEANDILATILAPSNTAEQAETGTTTPVDTSSQPTTLDPSGCSSTSLFSSTTGQPCNSATQPTTPNLPVGCTSITGFSITTGMPCNGTIASSTTTTSTIINNNNNTIIYNTPTTLPAPTQTQTPTVPPSPVPITINNSLGSVFVDPTFQVMTNITGGATNAVIGKFQVTGYGEPVKVLSLSVLPVLTSCTPSCSGLDNLTVYFNGSQVGSSQNWNGTGALSFNLSSQMIIPAGKISYIEIRVDLQNSNSVNYTGGKVSANLEVGTSNAQGQSSYITLSFPTAEVIGSTLTIQTGLLVVSKNTGYASQSISPNTAVVKIGSYILQNQSTSEGVRVTSLLVGLQDVNAAALTATSTPALTNFSNLRTSETSGSGNVPIQPAASNTFSVNFTLAPGTTKVIDVFADTSSYTSVTNTFSTTLKVTSIGASSNVSISQNGNGNAVAGQVLTLASGTLSSTISLVTATSTAQQFVSAANGGARNVTKAAFHFSATSGSVTISELKFSVTGSNPSTVTSITVNGISAPVVNEVAYLTGLSIMVPNGGGGLNQDIYTSYAEVGTNGIPSGTTSAIALTYIGYNGGTLCASGCTGTMSPISTPTMTLVGSSPTFSVATPTNHLAVNNVEALDVTVTANAKGSITLNTLKMVVTPNATTLGTDANTIVVKDSNNTAIATTNTAFASTGGSTTITFGTGYTISSSQTFKIFVPVAGVTGIGVNSASLITSLATGAGAMTWTDTAGNATVPQTNTSLIPSYPSTYSSIIYN